MAESLPSEQGAKVIFDRLLRNVYATFEVRRRAAVDANQQGEAAGEDAWTRGGLRREDEDAIFDLLSLLNDNINPNEPDFTGAFDNETSFTKVIGHMCDI